jgi:hypothetical protein
MAQAMLYKRKLIDAGTQTGENDEFTLTFSNSKVLRLYYSKSYKEYVLSFKLGKTKKFIVTKSMWKILKQYIPQIDKTLSL